jgi:Holliday junction resolvase
VNTKAKGNRQEHRSMAILEAAGYACTRSGASLGVFDIVGISATDVVLVQCKTRDWPGAVEMEAIRNFPAPALCKKLIHRYRDRQRLPDVKEIS